MANRVSLSFNSKNHNQNISLSNNPSIYTTNTSYNILSTNLYPTYSMNRHSREYEPSYPSITRYRTSSSSSSPYRKAHYLDDSVEEIIHEEILDIINLDHYPTLLERWGDDTRAIIKEDGEFIIEDYVEFEELEPTITEEISYEITYSNNEIKSTREIHHSHLESRNFRKIKKRRIKRKHPIHDIHTVDIDNRAIQLLDDMHNLSIKIDSIIQTTRNFDNDLSGDDYDEFTNIDHATENIITTNDLEQTYKTIPTINNGTDHSNINIIANETSFFGNKENVLKTSKSNEQQEYQNNLISQRIEDEKKDNKESRSSYSILMNNIHIPFDDHEIISTIESSINKENKKILKSDQQNIINEQEKMIIQKQILNHDEIQSNQNQTSIDTKFISSIENDHQSLIAIEQEIKHYFDDDLLSFLKILLSHLISNSIDDNDQSLICPTNQNMSINKYNDSDVETFQSNMKFEELKNIDKPLTNSYINHENILSKSNISETKQEIISKDRTKSNEIEHLSSKVLTKRDDEILTTPFNFRSPSDNVRINLAAQQENIHDDTSTQIPESINIVTDKQKAMFEELQLSIEEEIKEREPKCLSLTNPTIEINAQSNKSFLSSHSKTTDETNPLLESTIINEEQKSILKDHLSTIDNILQENKSENLSSNALIQIVHEIFTTPINIKSETIQSFEKKVDQPSINSLVEIIQQIKNIPLTKISKIKYDSMENICENKNQLDSNIISSVIETLQEPFYDTKQTFPEQTTISSNCPATHQRADKIKTDITTNSEEKIDKISSNNLNIEIDKQPKTMSTQLATMIVSEKEIIQKSYVNEDENVELPSDFLADIVRQIRATVSTIHFPLIDHMQQIVENLPNDFVKETTAQTCITSIPATHIEDNKQFESTKNFPTTENVHQTNFDDKLELSTTSIIPELPNTTCQDESLHDIDTYDNLQQSIDINSINQITIEPSYSISELTNIMNNILNFQMTTSKENFTNIPQQSKIIEQITSTKTFSPETDFQDFYQKQYSSFPNVEHISLDFLPIDNKQLEMKETTPDLTKTYYELKEQRYSQPLHVYEQTEQKQKTSNNNLNNHVEQIDLTSFSQISNLPSREYRQVFGVSHEVVNTINDLTDSIDQIIHSNVSDEVTPIIDDSNEKSQLIETFEDHPSIAVTNQEELINEPAQSIISNIELDFRYCSLLNQLDTLIKPILNLPSTSFINENESILSKIDEEKDNQRHLTERSDLLTNHITRLDDSTNASPIIKTTDTDKQVSPLSSDDQYTELLNKRPSSDDEISHTTAPYPSTETKIISSLNTIESTDTFKNKTPALPNQSTTIISSNPLKIESNIVSNKLQVNDTQPDRLSSIQQTSIDDHKQQDEAVSKPSSQKLQVLYDDYPWYSSYYTIADAELKIPQLYKQLNFVNEQNRSPTKVELQEKLSTHDHKLENKQDQGDDDEGFHIVQRRKRIPSSTTQTKTLPSTITTIKPPINLDIDLEPVILHGHSTTTITTSPIISQTITIPSKTKHKKKKKDKTEMIFFDAPQLISSDVNKQKSDALQSQLVEQERPKNIEIVDSSQINQREKYEDEQLQPISTVISTEQRQQLEDLPTSVIPNTDELKHTADHKNELSSTDIPQSLSTLPTILSDHIKVNTQTMQQQSIDKQSIPQPSPLSILTTLSSSPQISTDHLKQQDEVADKASTQNYQVHYDDYPWYSSYYTIADAELKIPQLHKQLNFVNEQNHSPTKVELQEKLSTHDHKLENEQDQGNDNEGFHIVQRRKRIPSSTTQTKTSPSTITTIKPPINLDIDLEPVILHGHSTTTITTSPIVSQTITIPSKTKHKKKKKDKTEMIFFDAPQLISSDVNKQKTNALQSQLIEQERPKNIEIVDSSQINQREKYEDEQLQPMSTVISTEQRQQLEDLSTSVLPNTDELKQMADHKNELTANDVLQSPSTTVETLSREINVDSQTIEQQSTDKEPIKPSSPSSITTTTTPTHTKVVFLTPEEQDEEDNEGFQVIQHQKHITSAPRSRKPLQSPTTSKTNYKQNISRDIDLKPVALHERHDSASRSIPHSPPLSEPTSTSTSQSGKSDDKVLTSNVTDNEVIISRPSKELVTEVEDAHQQPSSFTGLFEIMKDILSPVTHMKTISLPNDKGQSSAADQMVEEKVSSSLVDYGTLLVTNGIPISTNTLLTSEPTEETTHPVLTTTLIEKQVPSQVSPPIKDVSSTKESTIVTSEQAQTNEDDKQQQLSSITMFDKMKNLLSSTLLSKTSNETNSEIIQPIKETQQQEDTVEKFVDIYDSSDVLTKPTSVLPDASPIDQNILTTSSISSTDADRKQDYSTTDKSITTEEEYHSTLDRVVQAMSNIKETIPILDFSDEKTAIPESSSNVSDKSMISTTSSNDLDNEKKQQTVIQSVKEIVDKIHQTILPTEEQITPIPEQPLISNYSSISNQSQPTDTQGDHLSSIHQTSIDNYKQQDDAAHKPSTQKYQVHYDDYPWYSSYYTIADAELKIPQLHKQLNFVNEQNHSPTKVELQENLSTHDHKLENKQDQGDDDEGFHIVQRRKRIPSSTTQTKTLPSTITTIKPPINLDIDLEPVILHGHSTTTITTSPIIPQTTTIPSKTKHKKKKKDKTEMIFFDAPPLISSDVNKQKSDALQSQLVEQERPKNIEIVDSSQINQTKKHEDEQLQPMSTVISTEQQQQQQQPEDLSTSVLPNTDELKQMADHTTELTSNDVSQSPSTPAKTLSREVNVDSQTIEQQSIDKQSILQPSPSSTLTTLSSSPQTSTDHLKQQDEVAHKPSTQNYQVHYDDYPWYSSYYTIADAELKIPQLYEQLNFVNEQNRSPTKVELQEKLSTHDHKLENEQDQGDDNEGFHIVQRRKRIPSSTTQTKTSPSTITTIKPPINSDIDLEPVILYGHSTTTITTSPVVPQTVTIPSKTKHKKKKKDKTEMIFFDAPQLISSDVNKQKSDALQSQLVEQERPKNIEIVDSSQINQTIKHEYEQLHPIPTAISSEQQKPEVLLSVITSNIDNLKQIVDKENELTSNDVSQSPSTPVETLSREINVDSQTIEQQSTDKEPIKPSSPSSIMTTTTPTHTKVVFLTPEEQEEEDNERFQVIQHQKHITSAPRSRKPLQSPTTSKTNYKQNISRDIDLKPVALHERHDSAPRSIPHSPPLSEPTSTSTSQSGKSDDKVLTSNVTDNEVVIARTSEVISTEVKDAHEQQLSYTGLFEIMKDILSTIAQTKTTPSLNVPEQTLIVDRTVEEKASSNLFDYGASLVTKDIPSSTSTLLISEPTEETTHPVMTTTLIEKQVPSQVTVPIKDITSTTESTIITSQAIKTNEDDKQQQVSSIGMFDEMKNLSPSTLLSETSNETSSETIQPIVKAQEKEDTVKKYIDINDSSNISSKPTSNISSTDTDHPQNYTTTDKSITSEEEEEHHNVFDLVVGAISNLKETISNLGSSGEKPISLESPLNLSDKSMINIPPSNDLDNEKKQQTFIESVKEIVDKIHQTILPTDEQIIRTPQQSLISNYSSISNQSQPIDTQGDHLSSIHQTSIDNYNQQYVFANKPSYKNLQVLYDNYPWYSSYYTIADAEAKIFCLNKQLNLVHEQNHSLTTVDVDERLSTYDHELENEKDKDDDDDNEFQIIQGQKHVSSSTIHGRTSPSTITTIKPPISSDIDLEPVTHHGHPTVPIITSPRVPQTTTIPSKKKHKKKKKDKKEIILFDTPELISSIPEKQKSDVVQSELVEQKNLMNIDIIDSSPINQTKKHECKQLHPISTIISKKQQKSEVLSTVITSNIDKLKQKADKKNKLISKDVSKLLSTPVTTVSEKAKINDQTIEQQSIDKKPILQSSPSSMSTTTTTIRTKVIPPPPEEEEEEDNEGFQLVHYHKRILTATKSEKTLSPLTTTSKEILNSDIDLKTSVMHEHQNLPTSTIDVTQSTTSKKKKNKHKKLKKEIVSSSSIDSTNAEQQMTHQETIIQTPILLSSSPLIEDSKVQSKSTIPSIIKPTKILTKISPSSEEEDNEGFQVVHYRKNMTSALQSRKAPQSPTTPKTIYEQNISRNIGLKPVVSQERHDSTSRSIPRTTTTSKTPSNKQQKDQTSLINTLPRSASTETHHITSTNVDNSFEKSKIIKQLESKPADIQQQLKDSKYETISSLKSKSDQSSPAEQSIKPIVKEYHMSTKTNGINTNDKSSTDKIISSTVFNTQKPTLIEDDDEDEFQLVRHHKHKTSTITKQPKITSTIDQKSTNNYTKQDSSTLKSKKFKKTNEHTLSSLITNNDFFPLAIEENLDQTINENIQQIPELQTKIANNFLSNSNKTISINPTYEIISSQINGQIHSTDNTQNQLQSKISNQQLSTLSNEFSNKINNLLKTEPIKSISLSQTSSTDILSTSTTQTNDEQNKIISNEKIPKRRKKKLRTETKKDDDKNLLTSSTNTISTIQSDDNKEKSNKKSTTIVTQSITSLPNTSEISSIKKDKSQDIKIKIPENISLTSSKPIHLIQNQTSYEETNDKLDLFLPEYIRQQIHTHQTNSSSIDNSNITSTTTTTTSSSSSNIIPKKKPRSKMLKKDLEVKSLLTNEFDNIDKQNKSIIISSDNEDINDDDEFIIQTIHSNLSNTSQKELNNISTTEQNIDNILSHGFHHWLQESQALSQQKDKSLSNHSLTQAMQSIIIQPIENDEYSDDENSWNEFQTTKSTYIIGIRPEKKIHIHNAYSINCPESILTSSYLIHQSNNKTFKDDSRKYDSNNEEDDSMDDNTSKKQHSHQINTQSLTREKQQPNSINDNHLQISFTTDDVQRCLGEDFYDQISNNNINNNNNNNNHSNNYDDWAYFLEHENSYHIGYDLSSSLECFYVQTTLDDNTFLSNATSIHYSIQHEKQHYGDFITSNNDIIIPESMIKLSSYKSKPSESFQNWKNHKLISNQSQNDDEILISHSTNGLCRQVTL